ncbi:hypothetical protein Tco_0871779 [Tanacetum coccineum]
MTDSHTGGGSRGFPQDPSNVVSSISYMHVILYSESPPSPYHFLDHHRILVMPNIAQSLVNIRSGMWDQVVLVDASEDHNSEDEVASVDNEMASFLASKNDDYSTNSLLEQWKETYVNDVYDYGPYDDDLYEGQKIPDNIQSICDNFDIKYKVAKMWDSPSSIALNCFLE